MYIKEISGVAVSEQEHKRLKQALPNIGSQESVNLDRIKGLKTIMSMIKDRNDKIKAMVGGKLPKGKSLKDYITKENEININSILKGKPSSFEALERELEI